MSEKPQINKSILVTGDVIIDNHIYKGNRETSGSKNNPPTRVGKPVGGAGLVFDLLNEVRNERTIEIENEIREKKEKSEDCGSEKTNFDVTFGFKSDCLGKTVGIQRGFGAWEPFPRILGSKDKVWRLANPLGYDDVERYLEETCLDRTILDQKADIMMLDDGALEFRTTHGKTAWPAVLREKDCGWSPDWIVCKVAKVLPKNELWKTLSESPLARKTIVVLTVDEIRNAEVQVCCALSWERTALDLARELDENVALQQLKKFGHVVIGLGLEGAFHLENGKSRVRRLYYDPRVLEGDMKSLYAGQVFGYLTCMAAGIAGHLAMTTDTTNQQEAEAALAAGIRAGIAAERALLQHGHGPVVVAGEKGQPEYPIPGFPLNLVAKEILASRGKTFIPNVKLETKQALAKQAKEGKDWSILRRVSSTSDKAERHIFSIARWAAWGGVKSLIDVPYKRFGRMNTIDRREIEDLRSLHQLIKNYTRGDDRKPLSIAVFGTPGSGKSFSVKEIARGVFGEKVKILEFNLSQFNDRLELIGALHQVRDAVLEGKMPLVFWDEFDSNEYCWLQFLLAPMQDGTFVEGQITHPIGRCIFVFAGGTSSTYEQFGPLPEGNDTQAKAEFKEQQRNFKLRKGPDFKSRLAGFLNVMGPNQRRLFNGQVWEDDPRDFSYPVRRAIMLRTMLGCFKDDDVPAIDRHVLTAILEMSTFKYGARSMGKILELMKSSGETVRIRQCDLPPREILSIHAEYEEFVSIMNRNMKYRKYAEILAPCFHEYYLDLAKEEGWTPTYSCPYEDLPDEIKEDNIVAAERIPLVISLVNLRIHELKKGEEAPDQGEIKKKIEEQIELLAETEHDEWVANKLRNGWRYAPVRNDADKKHNLLVPYRTLDNKNKNKDRENVRRYPDILARADFCIVNDKE